MKTLNIEPIETPTFNMVDSDEEFVTSVTRDELFLAQFELQNLLFVTKNLNHENRHNRSQTKTSRINRSVKQD